MLLDPKKAFEVFLKPLEPALIKTIWRIVRHPDLCNDVLQETLAAIWQNFQKIQRHPNPRAMVIKISANKSYDSLRKKNRRMSFKKFPLPESVSPAVHFEGIKQMEADEIRREIIDSLGRLSKKQAVAVYMRVIEEETYGHIARAMGCAEGTVRNHVKRGREKLSKWLSHLNNMENFI